MAISRKIEISDEEKERIRFIEKGGEVKGDKKENSEFTNINLRIPKCMMESISKELEKRPWINRTQWILNAMAEKLETSSDG